MPKVFGWQHITYLCIYFAVFAAGIVLIKSKVKTERTFDLIVKIMGGVLLALIVWNRISISVFKKNWLFLIPDSFCGMGSLVLAIVALTCKRDNIALHYLWYTGILGGAVNVIYPYYVSQDANFLLPATISGLMHHSMALSLCVFLAMKGWFKPSVKKFYAFPLGVCFNLVFGIFLVDALGKANLGEKGFVTAMNIFSELVPGVKLFAWYIVLPFVCLALFGLVYLYEYLSKRCAQRRNPPQPPAEKTEKEVDGETYVEITK